jgi:hypothetical protein
MRPLFLVFLIGCAPVQRTTVLVRDPSAVSVEIPTKDGPTTALPADGEPGEATVPSIGRSARASGVTAFRDGAGGIALRCERCLGAPPTPILWADGHIVTLGAPDVAIVRDGDMVRVGIPSNADALATGHLSPIAHGRQVELVTPASNVVEVKGTDTGHTVAGIVLLGAAAIVGAVGASAIRARDTADPSQRGLLLGTGIIGLGLGAGLGVGGTALVLTPRTRTESM